MNFRILKKDFQKKKAIHLILTLFIFLAATFIAGSLNNLAVVMNGTEEFLELAGVADYLMITVGDTGKEDTFLADIDEVKRYAVDETLWTSSGNYRLENGKSLTLSSSAVLSSCKINQQRFFDRNDQEITDMKNGTIYLKKKIMDANKDMQAGDSIYIVTDNGYRKKFTIAGYVKDAFMGSEMMGIDRFIISPSDYAELSKAGGLSYGKVYSVWTDDLTGFHNAINEIDFPIVFGADIAMIKMLYVMDMVLAAILFVVSLCLVAISALMLRFTIIFTIDENFKEIGMMKAVGMSDFSIRRLYMCKYLILGGIGGFFGFFASIILSSVLLKQVTQKIVIDYTGRNVLIQLALSILLVLVISMCVYFSTGRIKKMSPLDTMRSGGNGERFAKKGILRLAGFGGKATTFLAVNDVLCEWKKYMILLLTSMIGVWIIVMPVNTIHTLSSENTCEWFSLQKCDFVIDNGDMTKYINEKDLQGIKNLLADISGFLQKNGIPVQKEFAECFYYLKVGHGENSYKAFACQGIGTSTEGYVYIEGTAPKYADEIAISHIVAKQIGAGIGDTVYVTNGGEKEAFLVTAIYQSMNNMGAVVRFSESAKLDERALSGTFGMQFVMEEEAVCTLEEIKEVVKMKYPDAKVLSSAEYMDDMVGGVVKQISDYKILLVAVVILINMLVVVLMQRIFLIRERSAMGMLKAVGLGNREIVLWQTKRVMMVLFAGVLLGTATGTAFSQMTSGMVFQMMGASKITFVIRPIEVYFAYPAAVFAATVIACVITMRRIRKIDVREINDSE